MWRTLGGVLLVVWCLGVLASLPYWRIGDAALSEQQRRAEREARREWRRRQDLGMTLVVAVITGVAALALLAGGLLWEALAVAGISACCWAVFVALVRRRRRQRRAATAAGRGGKT